MNTISSFPTTKQITLDICNGILSPNQGMSLSSIIARRIQQDIITKKEEEVTNETKDLYKELLPIVNENLRYLKSCLDLTEAHITWGTKDIKKKYSIMKTNILKKMKEQLIDKRTYTQFLKV